MIAVILRDHDVAHRLVRHRLDIFEQSAGIGIVVAGIDDDHALPGDHHHGVGVVQFADIGVDAVGDLPEFGNRWGDCARGRGAQHRDNKRKQWERQFHGFPSQDVG